MTRICLKPVVLLVSVILMTEGTPTHPTMDMDTALTYLAGLGYTGADSPDPSLGQLMQDNPQQALYQALMTFQIMWNLTATGELNDETIELMQMPRCGLPDVTNMEDLMMSDGDSSSRRKKRYALLAKWDKLDLTWDITEYTNDLDRASVDSEITRAFKVWSDVTPLTFTRRPRQNVDIVIRFASRSHGDGSAFDGRGGVLAHAFYPRQGAISGDAHFDEDERFTKATFSGTNLFQVAAHEFGHSLGLGHSNINEALMAPFYRGYQPNFQLHSDDIAGIRALYGSQRDTTTTTPRRTTTTTRRPPTTSSGGSGTTNTPRTTTTTIPLDLPPICTDPSIDAVAAHIVDGVKYTYFFKGDQVVRLNPSQTQVAEGYPKQISEEFPGLPNNLDAAVFWDSTSRPKTYFFKGSQYWRYENRVQLADYPRSIKRYWGSYLPNDIDAAFVWGGNGRTYFVKGTQYWRYGSSVGYPRSFNRVWAGLPSTVDGALQYSNGYTYFFKDDQYYRFNDQTFSVDRTASPSYPRSTRQYWLGCQNVYRADVGSHGDQDGGDTSGTTPTAVFSLFTLVTGLMLARL